jgi:glycerol-3-phosphate dehydrogenase subunit B
VRGSSRADVVVIGAGTAGLTAAIRLAQAGAAVTVVAKGLGSTQLAPGWIDVAGYMPGERAPLASPRRGIERLVARRPDHPYALLGVQVVDEALRWLLATVAAGPLAGYAYSGGTDANMLLVTALGTLRPSACAPITFTAGEAAGLGRVAIVGVPGLRDFHPRLCAENLAAAGIEASAHSVALATGRADASVLELARALEDTRTRRAFAASLAAVVGSSDAVGLPALLGLREAHAVHSDLEARLGRPVFEIPTLPPSVPGIRLQEVLRHALRAAGGRLVLGAAVVAHERSGERVTRIATASAGSPSGYQAAQYVLASGGFHSGALSLDSHWQAREEVLGLPLAGLPPQGAPRFVADYFDEQPLSRVGVAVHGDLRAVGAQNVFVAGASLPGAVPWREASGEGIALASGYRVAELVAAELGASPAPQSSGAAAPAEGVRA